jgi:mannose-1-phosphate guanylyltransferase
MEQEHAWAVILAGGDGTRLRPLTRIISGDARPKQFCPIFSGRSLLADTRRRIETLVAPERTVFSVRRSHERFWSEELADVRRSRILIQPKNRGTAAGIACGLMEVLAQDPNATICFLPADHYYDDEPRFQATVEAMYAAAHSDPASVILLGAIPHYPETEYGWIQAVDAREVSPVAGFREKPSMEDALALMARGYLWNTFVMAGRASAFFDLLEKAAPELVAAFVPIMKYGLETRRARRIYKVLPSVDFSQCVLASSTERLRVMRLENVRWSDLGRPERVMATLAETGISPRWASRIAQKATA